jgi:hypothetical protein
MSGGHEAHGTTLTELTRNVAVVVGTLALFGLLFWTIESYESRYRLSENERNWSALRSQLLENVPPPAAGTLMISLERKDCFGSCESYVVTLSGSGDVRFQGKKYVCEESPQSRKIDPRQVASLARSMKSVDFSRLLGKNDIGFSADGQQVTIALYEEGHTDEVTYEAEFKPESGTRLLDAISSEIDLVANTAPWRTIRDGYNKYCLAPNGSRRYVRRVDGT